VDNKVVGQIGKGLCVLIGIHTDDTEADMEYMYVPIRCLRGNVKAMSVRFCVVHQLHSIGPCRVRKILKLRLFEDEEGRMWRKVCFGAVCMYAESMETMHMSDIMTTQVM
jgi:D-Tyr-tRNAtyr deacylase